MANTLLTDERFTSEMAKKKQMLDNITNQIQGSVPPYTYMTSDEYSQITPNPNVLYWVTNTNGAYGVYRNGTFIEGTDLMKWKTIQKWVREGTIQSHYSIGDQITVTRAGSDIVFDVVAFDVATPADTTKTHSMTLVAHYLLPDYMMFDAPEPNNSNSNRRSYGNNRYRDSNIRLWLNSDGAAGSWWTAQHNADAAPNYDSTKAGFMNGFDADFLEVIGETKIKVVKPNVDGGSYEELVDKFYLPSTTEVGLATENNIAEGALFPYFDSNTKRIKSKSGGSAGNWWTRTPYSGYSSGVRHVYSSGARSDDTANIAHGVAPACNII